MSHIYRVGGEPSTPNEETRLIVESFVTMETTKKKMQKKGNHSKIRNTCETVEEVSNIRSGGLGVVRLSV